MAEAKTKPTRANVTAFLDAIDDEERRADCKTILALMRKITGKPAVMWGTSIVGFGSYRYTYASGRSGDWPLTAFSPRKGDISVYLVAAGPRQNELLAKLGRHKMGKACLYVRRLSDVDPKVLAALILDSVTEVARRYG
jgi:hypothetical protein